MTSRVDFPIAPSSRKTATIPSKGQRLRVVIDSDVRNDIDDQWVIALATLSPERLDLEGLVGASFGSAWRGCRGMH